MENTAIQLADESLGAVSLLAGVGARVNVDDIYRVSQADIVESPITPEPRRPGSRAHSDWKFGPPALDVHVPARRVVSGLIQGITDRGH